MTKPRSLAEKKIAMTDADRMAEAIKRLAVRSDEGFERYDLRVVVNALQNVAVRSHPVAEPEVRIPRTRRSFVCAIKGDGFEVAAEIIVPDPLHVALGKGIFPVQRTEALVLGH